MEERRQGYSVLEEKLKNIHEDIVDLNNKVGIQNGRIYKLEKWQAFILGGVALIGVMGFFLSLAVIWFHK